MRLDKLTVFAAVAAIAWMASCTQPTTSTTPKLGSTPIPPCNAQASWVSAPNAPSEIPDNGADICDFYQFSWQWFLQLVTPSSSDPSLRQFQVAADYPTLLIGTSAAPADSCGDQPAEPQLFVRLRKSRTAAGSTFVIPEQIDQAGGAAATIYDQKGNVVFYDIQFNRSLCNFQGGDGVEFPPLTTEIKTSWREITAADKATYFWMEANVDGVAGNELLGLVGYHLAISTALHPEFVWATFEHKVNAPDCLNPASVPAAGWSFTSPDCASCLASSTKGTLDCSQCKFNQAATQTSLTGTPTEICRVYHDGTASGDNQFETNLSNIKNLNDQLVGPSGIITKLQASDPMSIWRNYRLVGGIWENDVTKPSTDTANLRGSIQLANTTMETLDQGAFQASTTPPGFTRTTATNCFGCHGYTPGKNTISGANLSHIFSKIHANP